MIYTKRVLWKSPLLFVLFDIINQSFGKTFCAEKRFVECIAVSTYFHNNCARGKLLVKPLTAEVYGAHKVGVKRQYMTLKGCGKLHICFPVFVTQTAEVAAYNKHYLRACFSVVGEGVFDLFSVFSFDCISVHIKHNFDGRVFFDSVLYIASTS